MARKPEHPAIERLAATPEILRLLMNGVSDEDAQWKPGDDRWSIAEVLEHLSHVEARCFRLRFDRMMTEANPEVEPYDEKAFEAAGAYSNREAEESFAHWEEQREDNVEFLRGLDAGSLARTARHPELGTMSGEDVLNAWAAHDLGHVRQIAELVRTRLYYPKLGPFQSQYKMKP
jgi:hypothetical protein